jgi:molybdopterin-guanine dinucleotide biosynthesis protein A
MGQPKAWLPFGPELLLQRVVRILQGVVDPVVVVAGPDQELPELPPYIQVVRDEQELLGPLNGLATGLRALEGRAEVAYLTSCDVPFLSSEFVQRVLDRLEENAICLPEVGRFKHPLAAVYRLSVLPKVEKLLQMNRLRPVFLTELLPTRVLTEADFKGADPELKSLRNVNTPDEYEAALIEAGYAPAGPDLGAEARGSTGLPDSSSSTATGS